MVKDDEERMGDDEAAGHDPYTVIGEDSFDHSKRVSQVLAPLLPDGVERRRIVAEP